MRLIIFILALALSSCSLQRNVEKTRFESSESNYLSKEDTEKTIDKTITEITEKTKDTITTPKTEMSSESKGTKTFSVSNGDTLSSEYFPETNTIKTSFKGSPKRIPVEKENKIIIRNDVSKEKAKKSDSSSMSLNKGEEKKKESKTSGTVFGTSVLLLLALVVFLAYRFFKNIIRT